MWNPCNCECECDKLCDVGEYLDYKNCKCRKKLIDKSNEECSEDIDGNEMIYNTTPNEKISNSCAIYMVLFVTFFIISIGISRAYSYIYWYLKRHNTGVIETAIY